MKLKLVLSFLSLVHLWWVLLPAHLALGAAGLSDAQSGLNDAAKDNFDTSKNIQAYIAILIKGALSLVGIIFIVLIVLAGFKWMTSMGNSTKIDEAKSTIVNSVIGLVVVLAAYAIVTFVFDALQGIESGGSGGGGINT